ncbi:MAG: HNH endonuclease [Bacteroidetes bacterium]|nr:HNH endonuclease [Bacteroidota bacterium]
MNKCTKCNIEKELSNFYKGDPYWCKECRRQNYLDKTKDEVKNRRVDLPNGNRVCGNCKEEKHLDYFVKNKSCKDGRARTCSECTYKSRGTKEKKASQKKLRKNWYAKNKSRLLVEYHENKVLKDKSKKTCVDCGDTKLAECFTKHRRLCKICTNIRNKKWIDSNPEKVKERNKRYNKKYSKKKKRLFKEWREKNPDYQKAWRAENRDMCTEYKHRRRCRKNGNGRNDLTKEQITQFKIDNTCCIICMSGEDLVLDHKTPISRGGENTLNNIARLCRSCNSSKGDKELFEYIYSLPTGGV